MHANASNPSMSRIPVSMQWRKQSYQTDSNLWPAHAVSEMLHMIHRETLTNLLDSVPSDGLEPLSHQVVRAKALGFTGDEELAFTSIYSILIFGI